MKNLGSVVLAALALLCVAPTTSSASENARTGKSAGPIRVLFLGHENKEIHNSSAYVPLLMERFGRQAIYFDYYTRPDCLNADTLAPYDAVMLYGNHDVITPEQFQALNTFVEAGHGFLPIHSASACFGNDPRYTALVGGRFMRHGGEVFKPEIIEKSHPIFAGVNAWETWDETYEHDQLNSQGRRLLMERVEPAKREPWTWVRQQGQGRVFYTASGHDERTWKNENFQLMLRNAILWSVGEARRAEWQHFLDSREPERREPNANVANYERRPEPLTFQQPLSVKGSMERTQVPADMKLELFAAEPDIRKPIALAWDERGRCWVAETSDYPHDVAPDGHGGDRITICEDTNGDGRADKFTVFAEGLNIPTSLVIVKGGVIVAQPPRLLFLQDTNGDDRADVQQEIMQGWGIGDTHAQASSLHYGYDNWLHGCVGYSGYDGTVGGKALRFTQGTFRFKPDGSAMEFLHQFSNNSWGQSQNAAGDNFGGTANNAPIFFGGISASAMPQDKRVASARKINVEDKAHAITPNYRQVDVLGGYTAAAGSAFIYSSNLPPRLQGMAMVTEPTMKLVSLMDVRSQGAGYTAKDGFNLLASSDEWLSPVFAEVGPDGAVWVADWQNFIIQHNPTPSLQHGGYEAKTGKGGAHENPLRDHQRGRIYRVVWNQARPPQIRTLQSATAQQLVQALDHDTQFWRLTAQRLLVERKATDAAPLLREAVRADQGKVGAIHALWSLQGLGQLDETTLKAALTSRDPALRRNAVRALGTDPVAPALLLSSGVVKDPDPATRLAAMVKLLEVPSSPETLELARWLHGDSLTTRDEWLKDALKLVIHQHGDATLTPNRPAGPNILANAGFEQVIDNRPTAWTKRHYNGEADWALANEPGAARSGGHALHVKSETGADTSYFLDLPVEPGEDYQLTGWIRTKGVRGALGALLNIHGTTFRTPAVKGDSDWTRVEATFNSGDHTRLSLNVLFGGFGQSVGEAWFDDIQLNIAGSSPEPDKLAAGDTQRGEQIFYKHPVVSCVLCHTLKGQGSTVGPPLDGLASRASAEYIAESLVEPAKVLAKGYEALGASPMPPLGLILKPQELEDLKAYLQTLK